MGKNLEYKLEYRDNGKVKYIKIDISFVSRGIIRDYKKMTQKQEQISIQWHDLREVESEITLCNTLRKPGYKDKLKDLEREKNQLKIDIMSFDEYVFIEEQHKLIQKILIDNGVENKMLLSNDFWENQLDVQDLLTFLVAVIYKDFDLKKKQKVTE